MTVKCEDLPGAARHIGIVQGPIHSLRTRARLRRSNIISSLPLCDRNGMFDRFSSDFSNVDNKDLFIFYLHMGFCVKFKKTI